MHAFESHRKQRFDGSPVELEAPIIIAQDDARQGVIEHNMMFVLVIGLAGAIFANAMVLLAFNLLVAAN